LAIRENTLGVEHPATASSLVNLAKLYRSIGRQDEILPVYEHALAITEKVTQEPAEAG
jgi:Tetratricopeptide repeat